MGGRKNVNINIKKILEASNLNVPINAIVDFEIDPILDNFKKGQFPNQLKNYTVIRLVSFVEIQLKSFAVWLIDKGVEVDIKKLVKDEISIPISQLEQIKDKNFTKGGIIASNFNFQNLKDINFLFSRIYNMNLLETILDHKNWPSNPYSNKADVKKIVDNWEKFQEMFEERNKLVHTDYTGPKKRSLDYYKNLRLISLLFCFHVFVLFLFLREFENKKSKNIAVKKFIQKKLNNYKKQNQSP